MDRLAKCINNNHALYEAVFRAQGVSFGRNNNIWFSLQHAPPLYSNIVTRSPEWRTDEVFREIDNRFEAEGWGEWTIKDSFAVLDLKPYGFTKLFDAQWIYLDQGTFKPVSHLSRLDWNVVRTLDGFSEWLLAWDSNEDVGKRIFAPPLLDDPDVRFIAGYENKRLTAGCLVNKSDNVQGISNFFAPAPQISYWSQMSGFIIAQTGADLVGYSRDASDWASAGFQPQGPLSVWIKEGN